MFTEKKIKIRKPLLAEVGKDMKYLTLGIELFSGFVVGLAIGWFLGKWFMFSPLVRGVMGIFLATSINSLTLYKLVRKK